jgi:hypothetical protein
MIMKIGHKFLAGALRQTGSPKSNPAEAVKVEWLQQTLQPRCSYSVPITRVEISEYGDNDEITEPSFFQVLSVSSGSGRVKTVPTMVMDEQETARLKSSVAVSVQFFDVHKYRDSERVTVFSAVIQSGQTHWTLHRGLP